MIQTIKMEIGLVQKVQIFKMVSEMAAILKAKFNLIAVNNYFLIVSTVVVFREFDWHIVVVFCVLK